MLVSVSIGEGMCLVEVLLEWQEEGDEVDGEDTAIPGPYYEYLRGVGNEADETEYKVDGQAPKPRIHGRVRRRVVVHVTRSCVARRVPHLVPFSRTNSSASSPEEPAPSPVAPKPSSARIASSWGNIVIPSREEVLRRQNKTGSYKPDLSYLVSGESSGFASRLAAKIASSPAAEPSHTSQRDPVEKSESPEERIIRIEAVTAARRAEREAREHTAAVAREAAEAARAKQRAVREEQRAAREAAAQKTTERAALLTDQRRAERMRREAGMTPRQRLATVDASLTEARPHLRPESSPRRGSPQRAQSASKPSRPRKPNFRIQTMPSQDANLANTKDDITLEILETGGDDKEPAELTGPDVPFTNLDNLFTPSFERRVENTIKSPVDSFNSRQIQTLRETYAGDYRRFASQTSGNSVTPPHQLGPLKHAEIVLSRRSDVSIRARSNALEIISAAVGGTTGARTIQANVN
ncbi:hypothetical protein C0995_012948 [Termitomyces sp. Mi166|nr:hypothetical protein C0995_012948 [Termitomyces sp. Mi166\